MEIVSRKEIDFDAYFAVLLRKNSIYGALGCSIESAQHIQ